MLFLILSDDDDDDSEFSNMEWLGRMWNETPFVLLRTC